ncbi:efflux RND transporter periplasmic adaptor subunit [Falsiroseomonas oryzae]|uniref:efflux RND transporter periplasmic adaptor subunit n=1 Tax=Falsiroseomonas oryzae TaxID=2766473 RepID=UPI0022EA320D|nr:efflux RND transporter periplasmic adaptor subunit [Roseomonas sp. MO-31]
MPRLLPLALAAAVAAGGAFAWHQAGRPAQADMPPTAPPPMPVPVAPVLVRELAETAEFTGFLHPARSVELRPRVGGMIEAVEVPEGGLVHAGQVLFRLDQRLYRAALARAEAALAEARERHALAGRQHARTRSLAGEGYAPRERLEQQAAEREALAAQVQAAEAAVVSARLDLDFTVITAPIAGRIGRAVVTEGNLVAAGETLLAGIVSVDPMHVLFDVDEPTYLHLLGAAAEATDAPMKVEVALTGENGFPRRGRLDFLDNQADRATGTARLRAVLPNADGRLAPGLFARVRVPLSAPRPTMLVAEAAIGAAQGGRYVLVAAPEGIAAFRPVRLGPSAGEGLRVVREGLAPGESVVARGMVRPGTRIAPLPASVASNSEEPRS